MARQSLRNPRRPEQQQRVRPGRVRRKSKGRAARKRDREIRAELHGMVINEMAKERTTPGKLNLSSLTVGGRDRELTVQLGAEVSATQATKWAESKIAAIRRKATR